MDNRFLEFNNMFPNSKYRLVGKDSKAPINNEIHTFDEVKDTDYRIGWIVPEEYIVVDIDDKKESEVVQAMLEDVKANFAYTITSHGRHFIFKNTEHYNLTVKSNTAIGVKIDIRSMAKGYIILPVNDSDRQWGTITNYVDSIPFFLKPIAMKNSIDFLNAGEGDGRNNMLFNYIWKLKDEVPELLINEKVDCIKLINKFMFKTPLSDKELKSTVLRDEIIDASSKTTNGKRSCELIARDIVAKYKIFTYDDIIYMYTAIDRTNPESPYKTYKRMSDTLLEKIIHEEYDRTLPKNARSEIIDFIKIKTLVDEEDLESNWNKLVVGNGILNISTGKLSNSSSDVLNTVYITYDYKEKPEYSSAVDKFMNDITGCDVTKKQLIYEMIGYCLLQKSMLGKAFIIYGEGSTGKSTLLSMISNLLGERNIVHHSLIELEKDFMTAELFGKLANIGDDIEYKSMSDTATFKKLTTGELMSCNRKYLNSLTFRSFATLIFTTNRIPLMPDKSYGLYRRLKLIELNNRVENPEPLFLERLTNKDYEYLFAKSIQAIKKVLNTTQQFTVLDSEDHIMDKFMVSQSSTFQFLQDNQYNAGDIDRYVVTDLYNEYKAYCIENYYKPSCKKNFAEDVCRRFEMEVRPVRDKQGVDTQKWRFVLLTH